MKEAYNVLDFCSDGVKLTKTPIGINLKCAASA